MLEKFGHHNTRGSELTAHMENQFESIQRARRADLVIASLAEDLQNPMACLGDREACAIGGAIKLVVVLSDEAEGTLSNRSTAMMFSSPQIAIRRAQRLLASGHLILFRDSFSLLRYRGENCHLT